MDLIEAEKRARDLMTAYGVGHLEFGFGRGKRLMGICRFKVVNGSMRVPYRIELSRHYVVLLQDSEILDIMLHEIAHAKAGFHAGHGYEWKRVARELGISTAARCPTASARPEASVRGVCPLCERVVANYHRLPLRVKWHAGCGNKFNVLKWHKNGKPVALHQMPTRYQIEFNRINGG